MVSKKLFDYSRQEHILGHGWCQRLLFRFGGQLVKVGKILQAYSDPLMKKRVPTFKSSMG